MKFKSKGKEFQIDEGDLFMDNGACIQWHPRNETKQPWETWSYKTVIISKKEWKRILENANFFVQISRIKTVVTYYKFISEKVKV